MIWNGSRLTDLSSEGGDDETSYRAWIYYDAFADKWKARAEVRHSDQFYVAFSEGAGLDQETGKAWIERALQHLQRVALDLAAAAGNPSEATP